jgi:hypothetical protein
MSSLHPRPLAAAVGLLLFSGLASATTYANALAGLSCCFGAPDTTSMGQTFATDGGTLTDWSFFAGSGPFAPDPVSGNVKLVIANWDGSKAVGPARYASADFAYTHVPAEGPSVLKEFAFSGIDTSLGAGNYIAFLTVAGVANPAGGLWFGVSWSDGGMAGTARFKNSNGLDPLGLGTDWAPFNGNPNNSLLYKATIVPTPPVPEPARYALMLTGLGLLSAVVRHGKRRHCAA